jgi:hypothetical protein
VAGFTKATRKELSLFKTYVEGQSLDGYLHELERFMTERGIGGTKQNDVFAFVLENDGDGDGDVMGIGGSWTPKGKQSYTRYTPKASPNPGTGQKYTPVCFGCGGNHDGMWAKCTQKQKCTTCKGDHKTEFCQRVQDLLGKGGGSNH